MIRKNQGTDRDLGRVLDALPGVVWTALTDGQIEFLSRRWSDYTGLGVDESHGRGWQAAVHSEDLPGLLAGWQADAVPSAPVEAEVRLRGPDGKYRWFLFRAHPTTNASGQVVKWCGLATDIDEQTRAGNALREDQRRGQALLAGQKSLLEMVANGLPMRDTLEALCRLVEAAASGSYCSIVLLDPSGSKLQEAIAPSIAAEFNDAVRGWPVDRLGGPCQTVARDNVQVIMSDVASDDRWRNSWRALANKHGLRSCWSTPIVARAGSVLGTFALYWSEPGSPNPLQLELIAQFTNLASIAIERAQRDAALQESEARRAEAERELLLTIDNIPTLVGTYRPDGSRIFVNQTWRDYTGLTLESAREADRNGFVHPDDAVWVTPEWQKSLATGAPFQGEMRLRRGDGEYRWHLVHRVASRDHSGAVVKWYSVGADIENRKRAEDALRQSEARLSEAERELRVTLDTIPVMVWRGAANGYVQQLNKRWFEYTGTTPEQMRGRRWKECVHPDDLERHVQIGTDYVAAGVPIDSEARLRRFDGEYRRFLFRPAALRDESGNITGWYGTIIDIEDRKRAEEKVLEAERDLQHVIDHIPAMVAIYRGDGLRLSINKRLRDYIGRVPAEDWERAIQNQRTAVLDIHPDERELAENKWRECLATGEPYHLECRIRRHDGTYRWVTRHRVPVRDETGKVVRWYGVGYETEDRKRAETQLAGEKQIMEMIASGRPLPDVLSALCRSIEEAAPDCYCDVHPIDWSRQQFEYGVAPSLPASYIAPIAGLAVDGDLLPCGTAARENIQVIAADIDTDPRWLGSPVRTHALEHGVRSVWSTPIRSKAGGVLGTFCIYQRQPATPSPYHQDLIAHATHVASVAIERLQAEAALRRSEALLARAQRLSLTGSFTFDPATEEGTWSDEVYRIYELQPGTRVTLSLIRSRYHPEDMYLLEQQIALIKSGASDLDYEHRLLMPDGSTKHIHMVAQGSRNEDGAPFEYIGAVQDVTQRRVAEEELRRSEAFLAKAQRLSLTGSFSLYTTTQEFTWSEELYRIFEFEPGIPVSFELIATRYHPEDRHIIEDVAAEIRRGALDFDYEHRLLMPDRSIKHVRIVAHGTPDKERGGMEYFGAVQDVTQRHIAEEELRRSEAYLAEAQRLAHTGSWAIDYVNRNPIHSSEELRRLFGFDPAAGLPSWNDWKERVHPEDRELTREAIKRSTREKTGFEIDYRVCHPDGTIKYLHVVGHPVLNAAGEVAEFVGTSVDVTQRRLAEEELRRSQTYLAEAQRLSRTGSWAVDYANRKPIHSSEEHHRLFGFDPADGLPPWRAWMDRIHPDDRDATRDIIERSTREKIDLEMDYRICLPDGTVRYVHDVGHPILNEAGEVLEFIGTSVDVTQRRLAEAALDKARSELAHVTRVMSLGALTASIAHEVNQPLAGIITNASTCLRMLAADPPNIEGARMTAQRTIRDGNRAADVITRLRALFSKKAATTETVDLTEATREVLALAFSDLLRGRVYLRTEFDEDNPLLVTGDRVQLQQVILNLIRNASDAMREVNDRPRHLLVRLEPEDEGGARLLVKDAGVGIDPQNIERLFDAFYTTKDDGMGIGLSVSRSIIENHGGKLSARANDDGPGTTFSFSIPRLDDNATGDRTGGDVAAPNLSDEHKAMRNS